MTMNPKFKPAFDKLVKMGVPVFSGGYDGENTFRISGEDNVLDVWADYYDSNYGEFGVKQEICDVLSKNGLMAEWIDPGILGVYLD